MSARNKILTKEDVAVCLLFYERIDQTKECIASFFAFGVGHLHTQQRLFPRGAAGPGGLLPPLSADQDF